MVRYEQGYMSEPMIKFRWLKSFGMRNYSNKRQPLIVFGCYKPEDFRIIRQHKSEVLIIWMGKDSLKENFHRIPNKDNIVHATWLNKAHKHMNEKGIKCIKLKVPIKEKPYPKPVKLGNQIYTYLQKGKPEYHGSEIVKSLKLNHELLVGDHSIDRREWYRWASDRFYSRAFIGLFLSEYAGGGMSIQEMAVRGIMAVTNVIDLPNCIKWKTKEDIELVIKEESKNIGKINYELVEKVYDSLVEVNCNVTLEKFTA